MDVEKVDVADVHPLIKATPLCGQFVSIRPVSDNPDNKTYLGLYIGETPFTWQWDYDETTKQILVSPGFSDMPAIYVFALKKVVFGYESWWGIIKDEKQLKQITDADIQDIWYVKALKSLQEIGDVTTFLMPESERADKIRANVETLAQAISEDIRNTDVAENLQHHVSGDYPGKLSKTELQNH